MNIALNTETVKSSQKKSTQYLLNEFLAKEKLSNACKELVNAKPATSLEPTERVEQVVKSTLEQLKDLLSKEEYEQALLEQAQEEEQAEALEYALTRTPEDLIAFQDYTIPTPVKTLIKSKPKRTTKKRNYRSYCNKFLVPTEFQRFNPYSILDEVHCALSSLKQTNYIVTCQGDRSQRKRDYDKKVFRKNYKLEQHTFGTTLKVSDPSNAGYYKQKWICSKPMGNDLHFARLKGNFYMPSYLDLMAHKLVGATCRLLIKLYDNIINFTFFKNKLKQCLYALNENQSVKLKLNTLELDKIFKSLLKTIKHGWRNHLSGGSFGRKAGRPGKIVTENSTRPRLFVEYLTSSLGYQQITDNLKDYVKGTGLKFNKKIIHLSFQLICKFYASEEYAKNILLQGKIKLDRVLTFCLEKTRLKVLHNYVHNPVNKASETKLNTEHYISNNNYHEINGSRDIKKFVPPPPGAFFKGYISSFPKPEKTRLKRNNAVSPSFLSLENKIGSFSFESLYVKIKDST